MRAAAALLFIGLVLMALAWAKDPRPPLLVQDTTRPPFHHAQAADPRGGAAAQPAPCVRLEPMAPVPGDDA